jgi:hypothetical protein
MEFDQKKIVGSCRCRHPEKRYRYLIELYVSSVKKEIEFDKRKIKVD